MKYLVLLPLLGMLSCGGQKVEPHPIMQVAGEGFDSRTSGYAAHAIYLHVAISDSGIFWTDSIPDDGFGVWRPKSLPFQVKSRHYRVLIEKVEDTDMVEGEVFSGPCKDSDVKFNPGHVSGRAPDAVKIYSLHPDTQWIQGKNFNTKLVSGHWDVFIYPNCPEGINGACKFDTADVTGHLERIQPLMAKTNKAIGNRDTLVVQFEYGDTTLFFNPSNAQWGCEERLPGYERVHKMCTAALNLYLLSKEPNAYQ